jgi:perosamine synthetase
MTEPGSLTLAPPVDYSLFDPSGCGFPAPRVPLLPMLTREAIGRERTDSDFDLVSHGRQRRVYMRGRYALYDAYRLAGVGRTGSLLAPAYHCRTMLDPAVSLGAPLVLYPLRPDLAPDLAALRALIDAAQQPVRAMLLTHYFGFAQDARTVREFCDANGIVLIEDCSHALFNLRGDERLGQHGRYTIASPYKLFPCEEGGLLMPAPGAAMPPSPMRPAGWRAELRGLRSAWQRGFAQRPADRLAAEVGELPAQIDRILALPNAPALERQARLNGTSSMYQVHEEGVAGPVVSRWLMSLCDVGHVARRRRANFERWLGAMQGVPHCRPLFDALPPHCVPYMFPLLIDHPQLHFPVLKRLGVPIWRWDEMALSPCPVSSSYRRRLLHLPCHQALTDAELAWMIGALTQVMRRVRVNAAAA